VLRKNKKSQIFYLMNIFFMIISNFY